MVRKIFIGDKVKTPNGVGYVSAVKTWRDKIVSFDHDFEAIEFSDRCKREVGLNFKEDWVQVSVRFLNGAMALFQSSQIEVLEGRDDK